MGAQLPLTGIRVADFSWVGAGPFLTKPLADHGADVVKVESRTRVDPIRSMAPFRDAVTGTDRSGYFANRNTSKRSMCLDLKHPRGRELAMRLIEVSDVVVNNFSPGTMDRLGLGYDAARAVRPDVIYLEMPMLGTEGPHRDCRGYGLTIAAAGGLLGLTGYEDAPPVGTGTNYPDHVPNPLHGAIAVLAALRKRRMTGQGEYIELAQLESTINAIGPAIVAAAAGVTVGRVGNHDNVAAPHGVYPCVGEDRWCAIAVFGDEQWAAARLVLGIADLPEFDSADGRRSSRALLDELIAEATRSWDAVLLADELAARGGRRVGRADGRRSGALRRPACGARTLGDARASGDGTEHLRRHSVPVVAQPRTSAISRAAARRGHPRGLHRTPRRSRGQLRRPGIGRSSGLT